MRGEIDPDDSEGAWLVRVRFDDASGVKISAQAVASGGPGSLDTTWREVGGTFTPPAGTATMKISLWNHKNSGWVAYDDVRLLTAEQVTKYYYLGAQRVAMRSGGVLYYLHSDHLGSTSLTTNESQGIVAEQRYFPYGEVRWTNGTLPTDFTYTGQRNEAGLGLMDYKARYYSPYLGRFISPDSIVPGMGSQALNRYMYVNGNPILYRDPSGHKLDPGGVGGTDPLDEPLWEKYQTGWSDVCSYKEFRDAYLHGVAVAMAQPFSRRRLSPWVIAETMARDLGGEEGWVGLYPALFSWIDWNRFLEAAIRENERHIAELYRFGWAASLKPQFEPKTWYTQVPEEEAYSHNVRGAAPYDRSRYGKWEKGRRYEVIRRDGGQCVYCGSRNDLTVDHVKSCEQFWYEEGYKMTPEELNAWYNDESNLVTACRSCNSSKGSKDPVRWLLMWLIAVLTVSE